MKFDNTILNETLKSLVSHRLRMLEEAFKAAESETLFGHDFSEKAKECRRCAEKRWIVKQMAVSGFYYPCPQKAVS